MESRCPFSRPQNLSNFQSSKEVTDMLHMKTREAGVCSQNVCNGSLMNIRRMPLEVRPASEVMTQAKEFLEEYYKDIKGFEGKKHQARLQEVTRSITRTGSYELTADELEFGAKLAWRNAPRCIGRISWSKLKLIDGRHVKTAKEMFDLMLEHLDYATNGGNIRSTITVFPQRKPGLRDFRVWNQQLLCFAGYEQPDGSVIGDPAFKEFTALCQKLGWKGKGGQFDILPWVVSTPTGEPEWFEIPKEKILTVPIKHPEYKWFEDLKIEWFAVPAVSGMMFDCGGIQFPAAPFNGWYMASEIGTRDLCDAQRYNMLEVFGEKLGLDTRTPTSLWKDKATLEVNIAVLHSFKELEVTIVDHHTAAETFMQFHSNEYRQRGGCPADWAWIVPPISGSLTPVFHQEMSLYYIKPSYEYQIPAWVAVERQNKMLSGEKPSDLEKPIKKFKKAALAVTFASTLYAGVLARRIRIAILYGSETGKAQGYATNLAEIFSRAFNPQVYSMADYEVSRLSSETLVVILASTTGVGEPPVNGKEFTKSLYELREKNNADGSDGKNIPFWDDYNDAKVNGFPIAATVAAEDANEKKLLNKKNRSLFSRLARILRRRRRNYAVEDEELDNRNVTNLYLSSNSLYKSSYSLGRSTNSLFRVLDPASDVTFAVFALGSSNYKYFCAFGKYMDNLMFTLGGDRMLELTFGDETENQQEAFNAWSTQLLEVSCDRFDVENVSSDVPTSRQITNGKQVRIVERNGQQPLAKGLSEVHMKDIETCTVVANKTLFEDDEKWYQKVLVTKSKDSKLSYQPGDHVGILPSNNRATAHGILTKLENCFDPDIPVQILLRKQTGDESWVKHPTFPVASIRTLLERYLDITSTPSQALLKVMAEVASDEKQHARLIFMANNKDEYLDWKNSKHPNLLEVLTEFPSVRMDTGVLVCRLPILQPRLYSISSSPEIHEGQLALTVANFSYRLQGNKGPLRKGVCTSYLKNLRPGDKIELFHRSAPDFHLPEDGPDGSAPVILIGAGSGVAPLRGFWQHYHHYSRNVGRAPKRQMILYYGCQTMSTDLYAEEKALLCKHKIFANAYLALSRELKVPKTYVQDLLLVNGKQVYRQLAQEGGHVYICGSEGVADGVSESLLSVFQDHGRKTPDQARDMIQRMKEERRYHEDIFGNGSPAQKGTEKR